MVVPSGLADSLNVPSLMGAMGGAGLLPREAGGEARELAGEAAKIVKEPAPGLAAGARKGL
jgi:hypothetical protein